MKTDNTAADYIEPLYINTMQGRMLHLPAKKKQDKQAREILVIYGHHSSLERWWGLVQNFNDFGAVTMPDLPGFGGMDSFHKIGKHATLDNYADYMAAFIKLRYRRKKVSIVGISFGFLVATRMLQRYPELTKKVDVLVSAMGFMHYDNFKFSPTRFKTYLHGSEVLSLHPFPFVFRHTVLNAPVIRAFYARTNNAKHKFQQANGDKSVLDAMMNMEVSLWQDNDVRTYMQTTVQLLTVNNCEEHIDLPVWHTFTPNDNYFDNDIVEQQMRVVFRDFVPIPLNTATHAPSVVATKKEASAFIPPALRKLLRSSGK